MSNWFNQWANTQGLTDLEKAFGKNSDPMQSKPQNQKKKATQTPTTQTQTGPGGIPENLYQVAVVALSQTGLDPYSLTSTQWQQLYQLVQQTPALWNFYTQGEGDGTSVSQDGYGAYNQLGQSEFTSLVTNIANMLQGSGDTSPGQGLSQFAQSAAQTQHVQIQQQPGTVQGNTGTGSNLPNDYPVGQCTYYVASHYQLPGNMGNADQWLQSAQNYGMATSQTAAVGDIVVYDGNGGYSGYGHVAIVTAVNNDGTFVVSEMNYNAVDQVDQRTSTMQDVLGFINPPGPLHGDITLSASDQTAQTENTDVALQQEFPSAVSVFEKYFGRIPTTQEILQTVGATGSPTFSGANASPAGGFVSGTPQNLQSIIQQAAQANGLSSLLLSAQLKQESGFNANAVSGAGALGIAQFMPGTAQSLGVNPMDPTSAINGMAKLMAQYYAQFGSWTKALYAYNGGPGSVNSPFAQSLQYVQDIAAMVGGNVDSLATGGGTGSLSVPGATTDAAQQEINVRNMPSHLQGMNEGQYTDTKALVDNVSNTLLGHVSTDGIVQTLWNLSKSDPSQLTQAGVTYWYNMQSGTQLAQDAATQPIYNQIAQASAPILSAIYGTNGVDPNMVSNIYAGSNTPSGSTPAYQPPPPQDPASQSPAAHVAPQILRSHRNG